MKSAGRVSRQSRKPRRWRRKEAAGKHYLVTAQKLCSRPMFQLQSNSPDELGSGEPRNFPWYPIYSEKYQVKEKVVKIIPVASVLVTPSQILTPTSKP